MVCDDFRIRRAFGCFLSFDLVLPGIRSPDLVLPGAGTFGQALSCPFCPVLPCPRVLGLPRGAAFCPGLPRASRCLLP